MSTAPVLVALFLALLAYATRLTKWNKFILIVGSIIQNVLASCLLYFTVIQKTILQTSLGNWPAPFGISFYIDAFSALMIWISSFLFLIVQIYSFSSPESKEKYWAYGFCWNTLAAGVYGAFSTNDLFNLFVWFEVLLLSSYVLFSWAFNGSSPSEEEKIKGRKSLISYMILNIIGSSVFLFGLGVLYSSSGTLNFSDIITLSRTETSTLFNVGLFCIAFAFAMKAGLFPLFNWLPASYPSGPISVIALFAGLLTKIGIYALVRFFSPDSQLKNDDLLQIALISSNLTMLFGVYGGATHQSLKQILSFHIISQVGYMGLGFALSTQTALAATIFYLLHHMVVKTNLFLISGAILHIRKTDELKFLGGILQSNPWIAAAFAISALSLAGIPPFSGFWAKFFILFSAAQEGEISSLLIGLFVGLFTLFSMLKIWNEAFLKKAPQPYESIPVPKLYSLSILILTVWTIAFGLFPNVLSYVSDIAVEQMLNTDNYIETLEKSIK